MIFKPGLFLAIILSLIGLLYLYGDKIAGNSLGLFYRQAIFLGLGILSFLIFSKIDYRFFINFKTFNLFLYFFSILLLIAVLIWGSEIRGTRTWFKIGEVSLDPSILAKFALILVLAQYLSQNHLYIYQLKTFLKVLVLIFIPVILIALQPNLGSASLVLSIGFSILIFAGIKIRELVLLLIILLLGLALGWNTFLKDYQKERILEFFLPYKDVLGVGWQREQAKIAIGSGGLWGKGLGKGTQNRYGFLPESKTDFVFSAIGEEFGFLGIFLVMFLYFLLMKHILQIISLAENNFAKILSLGYLANLSFQFFLNVGMNLGFFPVIGISLPFLSQGGGELIFNFIMLGILDNIFAKSKSNI